MCRPPPPSSRWRARALPPAGPACCRSSKPNARCSRRAGAVPTRSTPCRRRAPISRRQAVSCSAPRNAVFRLTVWLAAGVALASCQHGAGEETVPRPVVQVTTIALEAITPRIAIAGVLAPLPGKDVKVGALVPGRVDRIYVAEGDPVRVGQVLAHIESQPLKERLSEVEAQQVHARAALENARTKLARTERLWKDGIAARQEVDDARAALVAAESALKQAHATGGI